MEIIFSNLWKMRKERNLIRFFIHDFQKRDKAFHLKIQIVGLEFHIACNGALYSTWSTMPHNSKTWTFRCPFHKSHKRKTIEPTYNGRTQDEEDERLKKVNPYELFINNQLKLRAPNKEQLIQRIQEFVH